MHNEDKKIDDLFERLKGQWDSDEPELGHHGRFLERLEGRKKQRSPYWLAVPVAAAILIMFGIFMNYTGNRSDARMAAVSPQVKQTQVYFSGIIEKELAEVEKENSPETKILVKDALYRMKQLENDYEKLTRELVQKGENKQIIHAMITNLQIRISFLEDVQTRIENIKKLKEHHENDQI
jgi:hypothetical protein